MAPAVWGWESDFASALALSARVRYPPTCSASVIRLTNSSEFRHRLTYQHVPRLTAVPRLVQPSTNRILILTIVKLHNSVRHLRHHIRLWPVSGSSFVTLLAFDRCLSWRVIADSATPIFSINRQSSSVTPTSYCALSYLSSAMQPLACSLRSLLILDVTYSVPTCGHCPLFRCCVAHCFSSMSSYSLLSAPSSAALACLALTKLLIVCRSFPSAVIGSLHALRSLFRVHVNSTLHPAVWKTLWPVAFVWVAVYVLPTATDFQYKLFQMRNWG